MRFLTTFTLFVISMSSCSEMNTTKIWCISAKVIYTNGTTPTGVCKYKITDGWSNEITEDSCGKYNVGDTVKH